MNCGRVANWPRIPNTSGFIHHEVILPITNNSLDPGPLQIGLARKIRATAAIRYALVFTTISNVTIFAPANAAVITTHLTTEPFRLGVGIPAMP
jgi:hypothetical protein